MSFFFLNQVLTQVTMVTKQLIKDLQVSKFPRPTSRSLFQPSTCSVPLATQKLLNINGAANAPTSFFGLCKLTLYRFEGSGLFHLLVLILYKRRPENKLIC